MGHYHIFFYSKANAPYFPGVGVSIDRCIIGKYYGDSCNMFCMTTCQLFDGCY